MSNINPIATTKIASGSGAQSAQALSGSGTGVFANMSGLNFIDLIIARLTAEETQKTGQKNGLLEAGDTKDLASLSKENPLTLLQLALASQGTDENGNIVLGDADATTKKLENQLGLTNTILNHLKNVLPENTGGETVFQKLISKLQTKSDNLQASLSTLESGVITKDTPVEDIPLPILILFGLNPSEISAVTEKVQKLEEKLGREITVEDMIVGVGGLLPPPQTSVLATINAQPPKLGNAAIDGIDEGSEPTDDLAAQLNALDVGGEETLQGKQDLLSDEGKLEEEADKGLTLKNDAGTNSPDKKASSVSKENVVNILNKETPTQANMSFNAALFGSDIENALYQQYGVTGTPTLNLGSTAQSANIIATSATAGQAHPATNMVAAYISKNAAKGADQTVTIRLDPPELGNVAVRLKFGRDNTVKAHLTVEKPETYMMLQRDALSLERTLQQSGFDTTNNPISFELANQGENPFNNNGEGDNKNFGNGGNASGQDALLGEDVIQSSVMWQVDPSTGHVRYNIFA